MSSNFCVVCRSAQKPIFEYEKFNYHQCTSCGLVSTLPLPTDLMIKEHYAKKFKLGNYNILRRYAQYYIKIYQQLVDFLLDRLARDHKNPQGLKVLDVGCFTGEFLELMAEKKSDVYGVELQEDAVAIANKKLPNKIFQIDLNTSDLPDDEFDVITLLGLVEHVHNPTDLINKTAKALKDGGIIMIQTPNSSSLLARFMGKYWPPYAPVEHIHLFSEKSLKQLLLDSGFRDIEFRSHVKRLPIGYIYNMLQSFGPELHALFKPFYWLLPAKLTYVRLPFYVGEMVITAKKMISNDDQLKVKQVWNKLTSQEAVTNAEKLAWGGIGLIHSNHNYLETGDRHYYWADYLRDHYFTNGFAGDALCLGCGAGSVDRILKDRKFQFRSFTGIDINPKCIEHAQKIADEINLSPKTKYIVGDLNEYKLTPNSYNFIYAYQSLHHIKELEHILSECANALRPGGLLMLNEYVGPTYMQYSDAQVKMANDIFGLLPEILRTDLAFNGIKKNITRKTIEEITNSDPSEAIRSADIEKVFKCYFNIIEEKNWGGTLNFLIFENIAGNFDLTNPYHKSIVEFLIYIENTLIKHNILSSDFKSYIARPKKNYNKDKVKYI